MTSDATALPRRHYSHPGGVPAAVAPVTLVVVVLIAVWYIVHRSVFALDH